MNTTLVTIQLVIVALLIAIILLQKPNSDNAASLSADSSSGNVRQSKNPLIVNITWIIIGLFFASSLYIARFSYENNSSAKAIIGNAADVIDLDSTADKPKFASPKKSSK